MHEKVFARYSENPKQYSTGDYLFARNRVCAACTVCNHRLMMVTLLAAVMLYLSCSYRRKLLLAVNKTPYGII